MLSKISPSILGAKDVKVFLDKLEILKNKKIEVNDIHIDVMDGVFVKNQRSLNQTIMIDLLNRGYNTEVHLMVDEETLENEIMKSIRYGAKKIWIHVELEDSERYLNIINALNNKNGEKTVEIGLSINPDTSIEKLLLLKNKVDSILVMSVIPGKGGQKFLNSTYKKIRKIRKEIPDVEIVVDGGINKKNVKKVFKCGADKVVLGHYLTANTRSLKRKLKWLKRNIKKCYGKQGDKN